MSDFLSNFNQSNYEETKEKKSTEEQPKEKDETLFTSANQETYGPKNQTNKDSTKETRSNNFGDGTEFDPTYHQKKKKKQLLIGLGILLGICLLYFIYYQQTHVKLPDFKGKELAEARTWATENKVKLKVEQEYNLDTQANNIIAQKEKQNSKIKKGSDLTVTASLGPDPEEKLKLPDFMSMKKDEVEQWIKEHKAENVSVIDEYSEAKPKGEATRFEIVNKDVTKETYKRKDKANMYYSKGKETFEKNIAVPDFKNKMKSEVESWAKTNEINVTYEESSSADIPADSIISQSIEKDQKIAKKDSLTVTVSLGKGVVVPNFAEYTQEAAGTAVDGLEIQAKAIFTENVPYGQLVSQSVAAGTELTKKDDLKVKVFYSAGQPYLKDLRGSTLEGDLPKQFYDEFQSKGANIKYTVRYVDSAEPKGTVVGMSAYNLYVPLNYTVALDISLGNLEGASSYTPKPQEKNTEKDNEPQTLQP